MLCENCHQREAVVKFTQVIGEEKTTLNLCKICAEKEGLGNPLVDISKVFGKILIGIISQHLAKKTSQEVNEKDKRQICGSCGLSWADFKTTGRLGCPQCYDTFLGNLKILLRRLHGTNQHIGKSYKKEKEEKKETVASLKKKLKDAIAKEEYELAAELRDHIREFEQQVKESSSS